MAKTVAIQGYKGCFHEQAARLFYETSGPSSCHSERSEESITIVECNTFEDLFKAKADAIVMAIENTVSGGLLHNFELLRKSGRGVKGEVYIRIGQNLMAVPGQKLEDIKEVRTHYMAINQTRPWFEKNAPWIRLTESEDTAKSAAELAASGEMGVGAVAGEYAASLYGLEILAPGIETNKQNFTRFLIIDDALEVPEEQINKALLCFTLPHKPGSLAQILTILSFYDMNLTRIQSLPIPGREWQYFFYADIKFENYTRYTQAI
ncbi:MAG: prephenate dehydratase, partial [Bacteroidales bacterium]|nr:prephenate dehydratase [Bacteroidales bacterium]